jgi:hypothetical protein
LNLLFYPLDLRFYPLIMHFDLLNLSFSPLNLLFGPSDLCFYPLKLRFGPLNTHFNPLLILNPWFQSFSCLNNYSAFIQKRVETTFLGSRNVEKAQGAVIIVRCNGISTYCIQNRWPRLRNFLFVGSLCFFSLNYSSFSPHLFFQLSLTSHFTYTYFTKSY